MYNKVEYNGETLIDLTDTTATENDVVQGKKFHDKSGALREGNAVPQTYTAGAGIDITNDEISAKVDGTTIGTNNDNELGISQELQNTINNKVDKVEGKGLSTNDFTNAYKSKIETNEYNDIFNIRVEWDRQYMPNAELIKISFQEYENGILVEETCSYNVKDITNGSVYLYKNTGDSWEIAVGTPPSSYHRLPMLVGKIATKTVNGESVKLFFRNDEDETQFDKLNSVKVDKETWELIDTVTIEEAVSEIKKNVDSDGNALKLKAIKILASLGSSSTSTAELLINAYSDNNYNSTVGSCVERLALPDAKINYVAEQQNGYWNAEWSGRRATTNYKGGYFLAPAFSTLSVTSKPYIRSWKVKTPTSGVTFSTSTTIEIWGIRGE